MKILWVENDMYPIVHHKRSVSSKGWNATVVNSLWEAYEKLQGANDWEMVLIDLNIFLGARKDVPPKLRDLKVRDIDAKSDVLGRLLGIWLWEQEGRRVKPTGPMHVYFTSVPDRYEIYDDRLSVEFSNDEVKHHPSYVLNKWATPSLPDAIEELCEKWVRIFGIAP